MNVPELVAVPPGVVTVIFPVLAPLGTVAVTLVLEFTVKLVAFTPPKVTLVVCFRLTPVIVTEVPTGPLVGEKAVICGMTRNILLLTKVRLGVVTATKPVSRTPLPRAGFRSGPLQERHLAGKSACRM